MAAKLGVFIKEKLDRLPRLYWSPKRHKRSNKSSFIEYASLCTTTELSNFKNIINHYERVGYNMDIMQ